MTSGAVPMTPWGRVPPLGLTEETLKSPRVPPPFLLPTASRQEVGTGKEEAPGAQL